MTELIEVARSDAGTYTIPGAAEVENLDDLNVIQIDRYGDLKGWEPWRAVYRAIDEWGDERWYFAR